MPQRSLRRTILRAPYSKPRVPQEHFELHICFKLRITLSLCARKFATSVCYCVFCRFACHSVHYDLQSQGSPYSKPRVLQGHFELHICFKLRITLSLCARKFATSFCSRLCCRLHATAFITPYDPKGPPVLNHGCFKNILSYTSASNFAARLVFALGGLRHL